MLLYEYKIRDEFESVLQYAENLRAKFNADAPAEDLLKDAKNLDELFQYLKDLLPKEVEDRTNLERHLGWMLSNLAKGYAHASKNDIDGICFQDVPKLEKAFRDWCASSVHYDKELVEKTSGLLVSREFDSAVRTALLIFKSRLISKFSLPDNLDGQALVNKVFGSKGLLADSLDADEREAVRDLFAGLYGLFRNDYMHQDNETPWHEADAILSMINFGLKKIDEY